MNKVTLKEYAKMIEETVQNAFDNARKSNALSIEESNILVDLEMVNLYLEKETICCLKEINGTSM